jgi:hypothetical protein
MSATVGVLFCLGTFPTVGRRGPGWNKARLRKALRGVPGEDREGPCCTPPGKASTRSRPHHDRDPARIAKRADRRYRGGRSPDWVKMKKRSHPAMERVRKPFKMSIKEQRPNRGESMIAITARSTAYR